MKLLNQLLKMAIFYFIGFAMLVIIFCPCAIAMSSKPPKPIAKLKFTSMTFNVGTLHQLKGIGVGDGYTAEHADMNSEEYDNNLAWIKAEDRLAQYIAKLNPRPSVIFFQEIFNYNKCSDAYSEKWDSVANDFVCSRGNYTKQHTEQVRHLLNSDDYYVICSDKDNVDNCIAVLKEFWTVVGCTPDASGRLNDKCVLNDEKLSNIVLSPTADQFNHMRIRMVNVHTGSGLKWESIMTRKNEIKKLFNEIAKRDLPNLIMGDMNIDPFLYRHDLSALEWNKNVGFLRPFHYISSSSAIGPPTHIAFVKLDHVISNRITGSCYVPGMTTGTLPVMFSTYWDHRPVICDCVLEDD